MKKENLFSPNKNKHPNKSMELKEEYPSEDKNYSFDNHDYLENKISPTRQIKSKFSSNEKLKNSEKKMSEDYISTEGKNYKNTINLKKIDNPNIDINAILVKEKNFSCEYEEGIYL